MIGVSHWTILSHGLVARAGRKSQLPFGLLLC